MSGGKATSGSFHPDDGASRLRIKSIAETRVYYGIERIVVLLKREGWRDNQKTDLSNL